MSQLTLKEQASIPSATTAGEGAFWVENTAPSTPVFTDDTGVDRTLIATLGTATDLSAGSITAVDWTVPSGVELIHINIALASHNASEGMIIQLGDSGGVEATGYIGGTTHQVDATTPTGANYSSGFMFLHTGSASSVVQGTMFLTRIGLSWACSTLIGGSNAAYSATGGGYKTLTSELTTVRLTSPSGSADYDSGAARITYWF